MGWAICRIAEKSRPVYIGGAARAYDTGRVPKEGMPRSAVRLSVKYSPFRTILSSGGFEGKGGIDAATLEFHAVTEAVGMFVHGIEAKRGHVVYGPADVDRLAYG